MKSLFKYILVFIAIESCSQKKESVMQTPKITSQNIVEVITKNVQHYPKEPRYYIKISNKNCFSEILVNDIPVFQNFNDNNFTTTEEISHLIFKNGEQKITYKLYNLGNWEGKNYSTLDNNTEIEIRVDRQDNKNSDDEEIVTSHTSPMKNGNFIASGKNYYEQSFTFNAKVPYTLEGFDEAEDLRKMDAEVLRKKVIEAYQKSKAMLKNHDKNWLANAVYHRMKNSMTAKYSSEKLVSNGWDEITSSYGSSTFEVQPLDNYRIVFFADGKLVALVSNSTDVNLRGKSALWGIYKDEDGDLSGIDFKNYLYLPKGKKEFEIY